MKLKEKRKKLDKSIFDIVPICSYDEESDAFILEDGKYMDILLIRAKDWYHATDDDKNYEIAKWTKFYRIYPGDLKIVTMRFRCNTFKQQQYLRQRMNIVKNELLKGELERKLQELLILELSNYEREFYLCYWGDGPSDVRKNRYSIMTTLGTDIVRLMDYQFKADVLFKLNNKNSRMI